MFANARSAVNKMESIAVTVKQQKIDCLALAETWFNDNHTLEMTEIGNFQCFRDDRCGRVGGGVAIWAHSNLYPSRVPLINKPSYIEGVAMRIKQKMFIICVYFPPNISTRSICKEELSDFLTETIDSIVNICAESEIVLCGDFNQFPVHQFCDSCNLQTTFSGVTYNSSQLDYMLMTEVLSNQYKVNAVAPVDNSKIAHSALLATSLDRVAGHVNSENGGSTRTFLIFVNHLWMILFDLSRPLIGLY